MSANSVNLVGDGDELDVVYGVERVFNIKLSACEAEKVRTVGELYDLIVSKRKALDPETRACLSQAAFYRLRRALIELKVSTPISPGTRLSLVASETCGKEPIRRVWKDLSRRTQLTLPPLELPWLPQIPWPDVASRWYSVANGFAIGGAYAAAISMLHWLTGLGVQPAILVAPIAMIAIAWMTRCGLLFAFGDIPRRIETIGDLAQEAAGFSFEGLSKEKLGYGPSDLWFALTAIVRHASGHKGPIDRDTTFIAGQTRTT